MCVRGVSKLCQGVSCVYHGGDRCGLDEWPRVAWSGIKWHLVIFLDFGQLVAWCDMESPGVAWSGLEWLGVAWSD